MFTKLDEVLDRVLVAVPWNDCVVYHKGKCVYRRVRGTLDLEGRIPVKGDELFNIYSCSKLITCTAALMLLERGMFRLTDPISDYLPEYAEMTVKGADGELRKAENPIRVIDLFRMTAGFTYDLNSPSLKQLRLETNGVVTTRDFARYHAKEPLAYEPGTSWAYSLAHDVLAALVEVVSGKEFNAFCKENIFDVVGMPNTTYLLPFSSYDAVVPLYVCNREGVVREENKIPIYRLGEKHASGGAGCVSTTEEYGTFLEALRAGKLISNEMLDLMMTDQLTDEQTVAYGNEKYGYGLGVRSLKEGSPVSDFGWGGAAGSLATIDRKNELAIFYAQHVLAASTAPYGMYTSILNALCGDQEK